ncbi:glucose-6-phosphate isomerase, putative (DUF641) [Wolffia australiana]
MAARASSLSGLLNRVSFSCLNAPPTLAPGEVDDSEPDEGGENEVAEEEPEEEEATAAGGAAEALMEEVFQAVAALKKAYVALQEAHSPWDPAKIAAGDAAVVAELRRLAWLRERFRRGTPSTEYPLRECIVPYAVAMADLKRDLKVKEAEIESFRERVLAIEGRGASSRKGRRRVRRSAAVAPLVGKPTADLFRGHMEEVRRAVRSLASRFLTLIRGARWDIAGAVRAILDAAGTRVPDLGAEHAKPAMEAYVNRKLFQGFENESFYLEGSLSSLLDPDKHRRACYAQFRDMRGMDPGELLGVLPGCPFGRFAAAKYLALVHPSTEESLFGDLDQRRLVQDGAHPRTAFYGEFLRLAKAVWLLHLLAFALDPAPSLFDALPGSEFSPAHMDSVVPRRRGLVGFAVAPGFKLADRSLVRARVYVVPADSSSESARVVPLIS